MLNVEQTLGRAVAHLQSGQLKQAEQLCRQVLQAQPNHVPAIHLLGVVALQANNPAAAIELLTQAVRVNGGEPSLHLNLGEAFRAGGQLDAALASYRRAEQLAPGSPQPRFLMSLVELARGDLAAAQACCQRALQLAPDFAEGHYALANLWRQQGNLAAARNELQAALAIRPDYYEALVNLGTLSRELNDVSTGRASLQRAIELHPHQADAFVFLANLEAAEQNWPRALELYRQAEHLVPLSAIVQARIGTVLQATGHLDEAIVYYRQALVLGPNLAEAHYNLGTALAEKGLADEAARHYEAAIRCDSKQADALVNLGAYCQEQGDDEAALAHYEAALALKPDAAQVHYNRGLILLRRGNWLEGWREYAWRLGVPGFPVHLRSEPLWDGSNAPESTLLVHAEQGLGDTLHFIRYLAEARQRCRRLIFQAPAALLPLLRQSGYDDVCGDNEPAPPCDVQIPLLSLPGLLGTTIESVPRSVPYLAVAPALVADWRERLHGIGPRRIGIAWQGSRTHKSDHSRSLPLALFEGLARLPSVTLVSLQKGYGAEQLDTVSFPVHRLPADWDEAAGAFVDSAAVMKNLDLVVTADTAIAHLAGALGVDVWVALHTRPDWRWLLTGNGTPWYPTMRLFRQSCAGHWEDVFRAIEAAWQTRIDNPVNQVRPGL